MKNEFLKILPLPGQEIIRRDHFGNIVIRSRIGASSQTRLGYENILPRGVKVGLEGWERAHSQGQGTGHESAHGIVYAPREVNQGLQRLGIESTIIKLQEAITDRRFRERNILPKDNIILILTTVTGTHKKLEQGRQADTNRLKEITYVVQSYSEIRRSFTTLFEASIEVDDAVKNPRVRTEVNEFVSAKFIMSDHFLYGN
jgi:hypothetical protein